MPYKTQCKTSRTGAKVRAIKLRHNFSQRTHPIVPVGTETHVLVRFVQFGCIWDHLVDLKNSRQNGPNWCKSSCHEVTSEFFATNAPDPHHWTLKFCFQFVLFWCIWDYLVALQNSVQNGQNWCKSSRIGNFRNESTRSDPLDPKLMFQSVLYYLGAFETVWLRYKTQYKMGQIFSQLTHPIHPIGP